METASQERREYIPHISLEIASIEEETKTLEYFMRSERWRARFEKTFPELVSLPPSEYKNFIEQQHELKREQLLAAKESFEPVWEKIEQLYLQLLAEHFETDWPKDMVISAQISILPVFPRNLDTHSFFLGYNNTPEMVEISAHEIQHFIWFKKWKEVFPEMDKKEFDTPHLAWRLSEIMDQIILQCHPKIKELIKPKRWGYDSFKSIMIGDKTMTEHFKDIYEASVSSGDSFADTLKKLWEEAKQHEREIRQF